VLLGRTSNNLGVLYFHGGIIVNVVHDITYNGGSHEFLTATSDMSLNDLSKMLGDRLDCNMFEIEVGITWRMLHIGIGQACYVSVPICSNERVNELEVEKKIRDKSKGINAVK